MYHKVGVLMPLFVVVLLIAIGWAPKHLHSQAQKDALSKLEFQIRTAEEDFVLMEPIPINFVLSNETISPIGWRGLLAIGPDVSFLVRNEGGEETRTEFSSTGDMLLNYTMMQPHDRLQRTVLMEGKNLEKVFPRPGRYEVRAEFAYDKDEDGQQQERIISNVAIVNIGEPQGINRQAFNYIKSIIEPRQNRISLTNLADLQQAFMDRFGESVYGKYMAVKLSSTYQMLGDYPKALRELCKVHNVNFYHSRQVRRSLLAINARIHPIVLDPNLPPRTSRPAILHPCTGEPIDPNNF
jgi:hypothetical protein